MHDRLANVKQSAVTRAQHEFAEASGDIQFSLFDKMDSEAKEAEWQISNPAYAQQAMKKAMTGMLELSMATMYKDAMSKAVEDNFEKAVQNYHARSINMGKSWNSLKEDRDEALRRA